MPAAVESMVSVREVPWHGLGTIVGQQLTAREALVESGLDWSVEKQEIMLAENSELIPGKYATVRQTDGKVLGVVGEQYEVLQNSDAFEFMDALVDSGDAKYETAGSLKGGRRTWVMMTLPEGVTIAGDQVDLYLALTNSHDGSSAVTAFATPVRVVCTNTLNLAIGSARRAWSIRHVAGSMQGQLDEARRALELTFEYGQDLAALGEELATQSISDRKFRAIVEELTDVEDHAEGIITTFKESPNLEDLRGTKWGAINAVGEFYDWVKPSRTDEARFKNTLTGRNRKQRDRALELLSA